MKDKKNILAETLENIQSVNQQIEENANHALSSLLKDELSEIIKKGLAENFSSDEDEETQDMAADASAVDSIPTENPLATDDISLDAETPEIDAMADMNGGDDEEVIDLTGATPEEVIGSFKLMEPTDEIEIVRNEDGITINFSKGDNEDSIESSITPEEPIGAPEQGMGMDAGTPDQSADLPNDMPPAADEPIGDDKEEEKLYEVEITEDEEAEPVDEAMSHHMGMERRNIASNKGRNDKVNESKLKDAKSKLIESRKKIQLLMLENSKFKNELSKVDTTVKAFTKAEGEYKQSITALKTKLSEIALYTSNITYAVKLMTENTTTKDEKVKILQRLDGAKTVAESREVFNTLSESFKDVTASNNKLIESKLFAAEKKSGASKINESPVYVDPQVQRIIELINKNK